MERIELYGEINISYDAVESGKNDWESYVSRLGLRGNIPITNVLDIVYQIEHEVDVVRGGTNRHSLLSMRNSFLGISGRYGKLLFGTHDTPFKKSQGKIDLFNDQAGDINTILSGEGRGRDAWMFHSVTHRSWRLEAMMIPADNDFGSSESLALFYDRGDMHLGFGLDNNTRKNDKAVAKTKVYDSFRVSMQFTPGRWKLGFLLQSSEQQNVLTPASKAAYIASISYRVNQLTFMAQQGNSDILFNDGSSTHSGVHYNFFKKSKIYLYYWRLNKAGERSRLSLGIEHKF